MVDLVDHENVRPHSLDDLGSGPGLGVDAGACSSFSPSLSVDSSQTLNNATRTTGPSGGDIGVGALGSRRGVAGPDAPHDGRQAQQRRDGGVSTTDRARGWHRVHLIVNSEAYMSIAYQRLAMRMFSLEACWLLS